MVDQCRPCPLSSLCLKSRQENRTSTVMLDLGNIINALMSPEKVEEAINSLTSGEKYSYLTSHFQPSNEYVFPSVYMNKSNRKFQAEWLKKYPWLVYSPKLHGRFCFPCALFTSDRASKGVLVIRPFTRWTKVSDTMREHAKKEYNRMSLTFAEEFNSQQERPEQAVRGLFDVALKARIERNRHLVKQLARGVLFCGKQGIALRGKVEKIIRGNHQEIAKDGKQSKDQLQQNPGNLLALLKDFARDDPILREHLNALQHKNATYISPRSQNEIIEIMGDILRVDLLSEIRDAKYFAIMADEVSSHCTEQLPLCVCFVDQEGHIRKEFLAFILLKHVAGEAIFSAIIKTLEDCHLDISICFL